MSNQKPDTEKKRDSHSLSKTFGFAAAIELGLHILVHYTVPGATIAAGIAMFLSPLLDGIGLTTVFTGSAAAGAAEALPSLDSLIPN